MIPTLMILAVSPLALPPTPVQEELAEAHRWASAKLGGAVEPSLPNLGLIVQANNDPIQQNGRYGKPLLVGGETYERGIYCHAVSRILVRLSAPAKRFSAVVGVDSNNQTRGGRGSVVFVVRASGKELFRSKTLREGMPGERVSVDLPTVHAFVLEVTDGGDGIACDQAVWAQAEATLADGKQVRLGELPVRDVRRAVTTDPPFSFVYGGRPFSELVGDWKVNRKTDKLDDERLRRMATYADPKTGLEFRCEAIEYLDFPTVEWTCYLKNTGSADTPVIEQIRPLDTRFDRGGIGTFTLHHANGSACGASDYRPLETEIGPNAKKRFAPVGGRGSNGVWPYFNLEGFGEGVIVVVGWPGQWSAEFSRDASDRIHVLAGQELTHFKLSPGEEVRTPLIVLLFWEGDWIRAQNLWRRWMKAHSMPRPGGQLPPPQLLASSSRAYNEMIDADEQKQIMFINRYLEERIRLDYWWMDAGWYVHKTGWPNVGIWQVDPKRFPNGFKPISAHAHKHGIKILVWFEPERVTAGTWLAKNHPEWIHGGSKGGLLNLGDPNARTWLTEHIDHLLTEQGIDLYRQDFNMDPLGHWRGNDVSDRRGITEIRHITGYLAYWDELRRRHPDMLIDSCASGGRRNDLETMRRAVPLWRSDYAFEPIGHQCMTYGLSMWLPFHGTGTVAHAEAGYYGAGKSPVEPYAFWSNAAPSLVLAMDLRERDLDYDLLRKLVDQWRLVSECYYGDFYPLTSYSLAKDAWMAWQFDLPEKGCGMVQAFRRKESIYEVARLRLRGLDPDAGYTLTDVATGKNTSASGKELLERGLRTEIIDRPGVLVLTYQRE